MPVRNGRLSAVARCYLGRGGLNPMPKDLYTSQMSPDNFHAELGTPEIEPSEGMAFNFVQNAVRITAPDGFRDLQLPQLDGLVLALDWVADHTHHI